MAKKKEKIGATSPELTAKEYAKTIADIKAQIREAQIKAVLSANKELLRLYWSIGQTISERRSKNGWGNNIVEQLAKDLQNAFPGIKGFSRTNFFRMQAFYGAYEKVPQAVGQIENLPIFSIPWGHNIVLIEKVKDPESRLWYAQKTIQEGWSRAALERQIKLGLHDREGKHQKKINGTWENS